MLPNESVTLLYTSYSLRGISIVYNKMGVLHVFKSLSILLDEQLKAVPVQTVDPYPITVHS